MYINDRDQINYHVFLTSLRTTRGYILRQVSTGVCCESGMNRFEKGNRIPEKLVRDRLTARLGVSCEKYEDYLQPKEYAKWEQRLRIVKAIEDGECNVAKQELADYAEIPELNRTNQQFVEAMRFMILGIEGASDDELYACVKRAVKLTVPNRNKAFAGEYVLADQEVNLILEQMRLEVPKKVIRDEKAWRISEYEKLITYVENSCWETLEKAKVYPRIVYYICKELLSKELTEDEVRRGINLCCNAIELLRDSSRLYYFIELTEARRTLVNRLLEFHISKEEKSGLEKMLAENNQWEKLFKGLYAEYKVVPYMSNFCYLYYENECHNVVEVIETRRTMLGISRVKLAEGICTERTIVRFEREGKNPTIELVRHFFAKMGLCAEYRRARVVTTDVNALMLSNKVTWNMNNCIYDEWENNLKQLENLLCMNIPQNKQEVDRLKALLKWKRKEINEEEFFELTKDALEYTLPIAVLAKDTKIFLTRNELLFVHDFAFKTKGELQEISLRVIKHYCESKLKRTTISHDIYVLEVMGSMLASYLGDKSDYQKSNEISDRLLKECLINRRNGVLSDVLYNKVWNCQKQSSVNNSIDNEYMKNSLETCALLCQFVKKYNWQEFFKRKQMDYV